MGNKSIIEKIQKNFARMSSGHKQIARCFLENDTDASYATTTQISEALQLSESTVVRFAKTLGYSGFSELRHELQESVKKRISSAQRIIKTIGGTSDLSDLLEKSIFTDIALLKDTIKEISRENFQTTVEAISKCKMGLRSSESLALFLAFRLKRFNFDARQIIISVISDQGVLLSNHFSAKLTKNQTINSPIVPKTVRTMGAASDFAGSIKARDNFSPAINYLAGYSLDH